MILYYGLTNYHLLSCILHKLIYNSKEESIFVASQGILKSRIDNLKKSKIFDEVYYLEDTNIRDGCFNILKENSSEKEIKKVTSDFIRKYEKILPFNINKLDNIYLAADHGVFGIYVIMKKHQYIYLEDGRGIYSNWKILDNLLKIKNPGIQIMSSYYGAYGKSSLIKSKYIAFDSQEKNCSLEKCIDFDVNMLLDKLNNNQIEKIFNIFELKQYNIEKNKKTAIVLTQRFSTYGILNETDCVLMYALLCDIFAKDCKICLKPHPADKCDYSKVFKEQIILEKEIPSELIRFIIKKNFDVGISTYSSSINSLKNYIDKIYNIDDTVINFKKNIFRLFALFEIAKEINVNVITNNTMLESLFKKCYNFNNNNEYYFNYSDRKYKNSNIVKDYMFNKANYIIRIGKEIKNKHIKNNLLDINDILYLKIENKTIIDKLKNFNMSIILPISKVQVNIKIEKIN